MAVYSCRDGGAGWETMDVDDSDLRVIHRRDDPVPAASNADLTDTTVDSGLPRVAGGETANLLSAFFGLDNGLAHRPWWRSWKGFVLGPSND